MAKPVSHFSAAHVRSANSASWLVVIAAGAVARFMIWFRGAFPRYRYDRLVNIGWKVAIPAGMAAVLINAVIGVKG
jgi:NADH-quinone oxidoreductase subunit H